jgi:glycosyltransferase involved in cell wall biosynthesis
MALNSEIPIKTNVLNIPHARSNPYHRLLYGADSPYAIVAGSKDLTELEQFAAQQERPILHLHWDDRMFGRTDDADANMQTAQDLVARLSNYKSMGGKILWTIHNRRAHFERDPETFAWAREQLCDLADLVHVHALHAARHMIEDWNVAPEKIRIVRHPSYLGAYEAAETTLSRPFPTAEQRTFLFFGMMRWSKGVSIMQDAVLRLMRHTDDFHLHIAGKAMPRQRRRLRPLMEAPNVSSQIGTVSDAELVRLFSQSQVFLAPFDDVFTSGTLMLAQTFGLPVIGPDRPEMRAFTPKGCHDLLYSDQRPKPIVEMMRRTIAMSDTELQERREMCFEFSKEISSTNISKAMTDIIASLHKAETHK